MTILSLIATTEEDIDVQDILDICAPLNQYGKIEFGQKMNDSLTASFYGMSPDDEILFNVQIRMIPGSNFAIQLQTRLTRAFKYPEMIGAVHSSFTTAIAEHYPGSAVREMTGNFKVINN